MWEEFLKLAMSNGLWAALFCLLLFYELRDSRKREQKYSDTVEKLTEAVLCVRETAIDVGQIDKKINVLLVTAQKDTKKCLEKAV